MVGIEMNHEGKTMRDDHGEMPATTPFFLSDVACTKPLYLEHLIVHSLQKETHP